MGDQAPGKDEGKGKAAKVSDTDAKTAEKKAASGPPGGKGDKKTEKEPDQKPDAKKDKKSKPAGKKSSSGFAVLVGAIVFFIAVV
ncbi:MAG: hypothetical protein OEY85_14720, partial [Rhodospirillales bacterium]|nr:hypothetical protein [Rhodospirillales bacterium]